MSTRQRQGTILFTALLMLVGIGVVVQLWLLTASVDAFMRHQARTAVHATLASVAVFVINGLLILYVFNFDRKIKQDRS
jgi:ABC-type lipoprotein release transport system permease subunit